MAEKTQQRKTGIHTDIADAFRNIGSTVSESWRNRNNRNYKKKVPDSKKETPVTKTDNQSSLPIFGMGWMQPSAQKQESTLSIPGLGAFIPPVQKTEQAWLPIPGMGWMGEAKNPAPKPEQITQVEQAKKVQYQLPSGIAKEDVQAIQRRLKDEGYFLGNTGVNKDGIDGDWGTKTQAAYDAFRQKQMQASTAVPTEESYMPVAAQQMPAGSMQSISASHWRRPIGSSGQTGDLKSMGVSLQSPEALNAQVAANKLQNKRIPLTTKKFGEFKDGGKIITDLINEFKKGGKIYIKPENRGKFTATKKKTGKSTEELTHSKNPVTKKRAVFAANAAKWKKGKK